MITTLKKLGAFLILLSLTNCGGNGSNNSDTNDSPSPGISEKIINGSPVDPVASPQIVEVLIQNADGSTSLCSGTVIGSQDVLTAGHCVANGGVISIKAGETVQPSQAFFISPQYFIDSNVNAIFSDVAIVRTQTPHNLPALSIIASHPVLPGSEMTVYGFGVDENGLYGTLKSGVTQATIVTENHLFGAPFSGSGTNSCSGDSGGPAVQSFVDETGQLVVGLVGLVSTGTAVDCFNNDTTLFANLQNPGILEFIVGTTPEVVVR